MKFVIQIFKSAKYIEKPDYNTESRNLVGKFEKFVSKTGHLVNNELFLPDKLSKVFSNQNNILIIQDVNNSFHTGKIPELYETFHQGQQHCLFELFNFKIIDNQKTEISFIYNASIGLPKRENHKIAELAEGESIRFTTNGKHDFTLTGRKQRTFSEFDYIIQFVGVSKKIEFVDYADIEIIKTIPDNYKIINERKILL